MLKKILIISFFSVFLISKGLDYNTIHNITITKNILKIEKLNKQQLILLKSKVLKKYNNNITTIKKNIFNIVLLNEYLKKAKNSKQKDIINNLINSNNYYINKLKKENNEFVMYMTVIQDKLNSLK